MKNIIKYPQEDTWESLLQRPTLEKKDLRNTVQEIFLKVRAEGDSALKELSAKYDQVTLRNLLVSEKEIEIAINEVPEELKTAINQAKENI